MCCQLFLHHQEWKAYMLGKCQAFCICCRFCMLLVCINVCQNASTLCVKLFVFQTCESSWFSWQVTFEHAQTMDPQYTCCRRSSLLIDKYLRKRIVIQIHSKIAGLVLNGQVAVESIDAEALADNMMMAKEIPQHGSQYVPLMSSPS